MGPGHFYYAIDTAWVILKWAILKSLQNIKMDRGMSVKTVAQSVQ